MRYILTALEAVEEIGNLEEEEEVDIIEEIVEVLKRRQKDKLPVLRDIPKKKLLKETAKVFLAIPAKVRRYQERVDMF